jgi:hypothetical protein
MDVAIARGSRLPPSAWPSQTFEMNDPRASAGCSRVLRQQAELYGYQDRDPERNRLGLSFTAGTQHHRAFVPFVE